MNIEEVAAKLRARKISAMELAQESIRCIHDKQPLLNAFITITEDLALEQARRADDELSRGIDRGPLHGIPYTLKDLFETRGIRTTAGSKIFADYVPDRDCEVYQRLTTAGAVLMGKTGMHELAYGITNDNPHFGRVRNPRDPTRISGGSSGGSAAAVAADLVFFRAGDRSRRFDTHSGRILRMRRIQAHLRTREPCRSTSAFLQHGSCGSSHAFRS